ncbi:MAG: hypothetical protein CMM01_16765 [Rhodopirellula sp.]|nr:hypothetical protein [Rhodopirellula sp.]
MFTFDLAISLQLAEITCECIVDTKHPQGAAIVGTLQYEVDRYPTTFSLLTIKHAAELLAVSPQPVRQLNAHSRQRRLDQVHSERLAQSNAVQINSADADPRKINRTIKMPGGQ